MNSAEILLKPQITSVQGTHIHSKRGIGQLKALLPYQLKSWSRPAEQGAGNGNFLPPRQSALVTQGPLAHRHAGLPQGNAGFPGEALAFPVLIYGITAQEKFLKCSRARSFEKQNQYQTSNSKI